MLKQGGKITFLSENTLYWKENIWKKVWELEDTIWKIEKQLHRIIDLLGGVCPDSRYITCWSIAGKYPERIRDCEILTTVICHTNDLRVDEFKSKSKVRTEKNI